MKQVQEANLDYCLKCSTCHTQCPVVLNFLPFPGPKHMGPELERLRLSKKQGEVLKIDENLTYCTNCKRCDMACPHGVKPSYYNIKNKAKAKTAAVQKFRDWILAHNYWWGRSASKVPRLGSFILKLAPVKLVLKTIGMADRDFPEYKGQRFKPKIQKEQTQKEQKGHKKQGEQKKVLYFPGCYASFNQPEIIQAAVEILEAARCQVEVAPSGCCGTPLLSNGFLVEAGSWAKRITAVFLEYIEKGYKIVVSCPSCGLAFKDEYRDLLAVEQSELLSQHIYELFELLAEEENLPFEIFNKDKAKIKGAFYHIPCHLKAQGMGFPGAHILKNTVVEDLLVEDSFCCGISGTFGFKREKQDLAAAIGGSLFNAIKDSKVKMVITDCGTCMVQIRQHTCLEVKHPVLVLKDFLQTQKGGK